MNIRFAEERDLESINHLCNWHATNGFSTFLETQTLEERKLWFKRFDSPAHTAFVAEENSQIVGVACSFAYRGGGVFARTVETSIYVHFEWMGKGIGRALYERLFEHLKGTDVHRVVAGIALPNEASVALHKKFGFSEVGIFDEYAFYRGSYRSSLWMQKKIER